MTSAVDKMQPITGSASFVAFLFDCLSAYRAEFTNSTHTHDKAITYLLGQQLEIIRQAGVASTASMRPESLQSMDDKADISVTLAMPAPLVLRFASWGAENLASGMTDKQRGFALEIAQYGQAFGLME